jgi:general secretion pathway protein A
MVRTVLAENTQGECVLISNPTLTRSEFYEALTEGFPLEAGAAGSKTHFLTALRCHLEQRQALGRPTTLLLDEAQSLPYELLEEVRLLSNLETPTTKLLNVVLAGQPELADRFNEPRLRQLKQRIGLRCVLRTFTREETAAYVAGRIRIAGGSPAAIFTREAIESIYEASLGVPRIINVVCGNSLIGGFAAGLRPIPRAIVDEVVRDFDLRPSDAGCAAPATTPISVPAVTVEPETPQVPAAGAAGVSQAGEPFLAHMFDRKRRFSFF